MAVTKGKESKWGAKVKEVSFYYATIAYHVGLNVVLGLPHPGPTS